MEGRKYLIILVTPRVVLSHPHDKVQDRYERPNSIGVAAKHDVAEANVVVCSNMACCYTREG